MQTEPLRIDLSFDALLRKRGSVDRVGRVALARLVTASRPAGASLTVSPDEGPTFGERIERDADVRYGVELVALDGVVTVAGTVVTAAVSELLVGVVVATGTGTATVVRAADVAVVVAARPGSVDVGCGAVAVALGTSDETGAILTTTCEP